MAEACGWNGDLEEIWTCCDQEAGENKISDTDCRFLKGGGGGV